MPSFEKEDIQNIQNINQNKPRFIGLLRIIFTFILVFVLVFFGSLAFNISSNGSKIFESEENSCANFWCNITNNFGKTIQSVISDVNLKGQSEGRTNILILGLDADYGNTDTIIIASIFHKTGKIVTFSLPRDLYVDNGILDSKLNGIYPIAENKVKNSGVSTLSNFLRKEYNLPIHYWATIRFEGVEKIVDSLGGVEINVENEFQDCEFPNKTYGYLPCQSFSKGLQMMNGKNALIYARSRKGTDGEGSDFARSRRQSIVIQAVISRFKSQNFFDINKINSILDSVGSTVRLGMNAGDLKSILNFVKKIDPKNDVLKYNFAVDQVELCEFTDNVRGYYIYYCDESGTNGTFAGSKKYSSSRIKIQELFQDPISNIILTELRKKSIILYANQADSANEIKKTLTNGGFSNLVVNNLSKQKKPAGKIETVKFYVNSEIVQKELEQIDFGFSFEYTVIVGKPTVILSDNTVYDIVIEVD